MKEIGTYRRPGAPLGCGRFYGIREVGLTAVKQDVIQVLIKDTLCGMDRQGDFAWINVDPWDVITCSEQAVLEAREIAYHANHS